MTRLAEHLPDGAADRVALVTRTGTATWGELLARRPPAEAGARSGVYEPNSPALVERLVAELNGGVVPILAHPRWPRALAERALDRAGRGRPWRGAPLATLLFTSGSTAEPKVVAHTLAAHLANARASAERLPFQEGHRWLLSLPLCHVGGLSLVFRAVVGGATLALPEPGASLAASLVELRPTHLSLVPTQLRALLDDPSLAAALARLEGLLVGGGPCPPEWVAEARAAGVPVRTTYGSTECASQVATSRVDDPPSAARPLPGVELAFDEAGELRVRTPSLFAGYLEDDRLRTPFEDGWFPTGDLGRIDAEGRLELVGRRDNQFVSGGENVQPEAIEAAFRARGHEVVVVGVPDERFGARPVAFTPDGVSLDALAEELLPDFARPVAWHALGATDGWKPRRAELARRARELGR
ncbi:MAG: AMP-binding protein [Planctomycetota bacterium]